MKGRKPKPTALKLLTGNPGKRALNKNESKPRPIIGVCPSWLSKEAKEAWKFYSREAHWLTAADYTLLVVLCQSIAHWREAREWIKRDGLFDESKPTVRPHPALKVAADCEKIMLKISQEFGLTPASRSRLNLPEIEEADDFDRFLNS